MLWTHTTDVDSSVDQNVIVEYICKCVGSGRAIVPASVVLTLLEHLAVRAEQEPESKDGMEELFVGIVRCVLDAHSNLDGGSQSLSKVSTVSKGLLYHQISFWSFRAC